MPWTAPRGAVPQTGYEGLDTSPGMHQTEGMRISERDRFAHNEGMCGASCILCEWEDQLKDAEENLCAGCHEPITENDEIHYSEWGDWHKFCWAEDQ